MQQLKKALKLQIMETTKKPTKQELINSINWDLPFNELSDEHKCNFLSLHKVGMLPRKGFTEATDRLLYRIHEAYKADQMIVGERGVDRLHMYID